MCQGHECTLLSLLEELLLLSLRASLYQVFTSLALLGALGHEKVGFIVWVSQSWKADQNTGEDDLACILLVALHQVWEKILAMSC